MAEKDKVHLLRDDNYSSFEMPNNIHVQEIIEMFQISNVQEGFSMEKLAKFKGVKGLAKTLKTDLKVRVAWGGPFRTGCATTRGSVNCEDCTGPTSLCRSSCSRCVP